MMKNSMIKKILTKLKNKDKKYVDNIMKERDLPDWFRGLSRFQLDAVHSLLYSIRDDMQQETSHRVRDVLRRIGIDPLVGPSKLKLLMKLSGGNDIAFLWFLMEMYYRSSPGYIGRKYTYSTIEQIIITSIAHLDLLPTLRELNKLLPKQIKVPKPIKKPVTPKKKKSDTSIQCPYFQKLPRPKIFATKLTMDEVPFKVNFNDFSVCLKPNYISLNEQNRWFENFGIRKNKNIASGIIQDQIDAALRGKSHGSLSVCANHEVLRLMKENVKAELMVAKRKACEEYFDVDKYFQTESYKRVMKQLNSEISRVENDLKHCEKLHAENRPSVKKKHKIQSDNEDMSEEEEQLYNFGFDGAFGPKSKYFNAPTGNTPYKFYYENIFDIDVCKDVVKDAFAKALDSDDSGKMSIEQNRAIQKYCKKTWNNEVEVYNKAKKKELARAELQPKIKKKEIVLTKDMAQQNSMLNLTTDNLRSRKVKNEESELSIIAEHEREGRPFDPRDSNFVHSILASAFKEMRKNKKYVLATIPHAYKLPVLREWVRNRYGIEYSRKEKLKAYVRTKKMSYILLKNALNIRIPQVSDLSQQRFVSYNCKEYILKKTNYLRAKYESDYKECMMHVARILWATHRPFQCRKPPIKTFFAYMPPRKNDVLSFRPWKSHEFMPAKKEWDKRMTKQRKEKSY